MSESESKAIEELVKAEFKIWVFGFGKKGLMVNDLQSLRVRIRDDKFNVNSTRNDLANQVWFFMYQRITDELERILGKNIWHAVMVLEKDNHHLMDLEPVIKSAGEAEMSNPVSTLFNKLVNILMQER